MLSCCEATDDERVRHMQCCKCGLPFSLCLQHDQPVGCGRWHLVSHAVQFDKSSRLEITEEKAFVKKGWDWTRGAISVGISAQCGYTYLGGLVSHTPWSGTLASLNSYTCWVLLVPLGESTQQRVFDSTACMMLQGQGDQLACPSNDSVPTMPIHLVFDTCRTLSCGYQCDAHSSLH